MDLKQHEVLLFDCGSVKGTKLNDFPVEKAEIMSGDALRDGEFTVCISSSAKAPRSAVNCWPNETIAGR